jgi:hypothetical protein
MERHIPNYLLEIRNYAQAIEQIFSASMKHTHEAFVQNKRQAP